jgi:hypothetical protein
MTVLGGGEAGAGAGATTTSRWHATRARATKTVEKAAAYFMLKS